MRRKRCRLILFGAHITGQDRPRRIRLPSHGDGRLIRRSPLLRETRLPGGSDKDHWFWPSVCGNSYFRYPCLKNFFLKSSITNDPDAAKAHTTPSQAALSRETCFSSRQPSIRLMWI